MNDAEVKRLVRYMAAMRVIALLMGVGFLIFAISIALSDDPDIYAIGLTSVVCLVSFVLAIFGFKWFKRSLWIYSSCTPRTMSISAREIKWSEGPHDYEFLLQSDSEQWLVRVLKSGANFEPLENDTTSCAVYFDPDSQKPDVIETPYGLLWRGGSKAVQLKASNHGIEPTGDTRAGDFK